MSRLDLQAMRDLCDPSNKHGMPKEHVLQLIALVEAADELERVARSNTHVRMSGIYPKDLWAAVYAYETLREGMR